MGHAGVLPVFTAFHVASFVWKCCPAELEMGCGGWGKPQPGRGFRANDTTSVGKSLLEVNLIAVLMGNVPVWPGNV